MFRMHCYQIVCGLLILTLILLPTMVSCGKQSGSSTSGVSSDASHLSSPDDLLVYEPSPQDIQPEGVTPPAPTPLVVEAPISMALSVREGQDLVALADSLRKERKISSRGAHELKKKLESGGLRSILDYGDSEAQRYVDTAKKAEEEARAEAKIQGIDTASIQGVQWIGYLIGFFLINELLQNLDASAASVKDVTSFMQSIDVSGSSQATAQFQTKSGYLTSTLENREKAKACASEKGCPDEVKSSFESIVSQFQLN